MAIDLSNISSILKSTREQLLAKPNVVATGIGYKFTGGQKTESLSIVCSVVNKMGKARLSAADLVPETVNGIPTDVIQTGPIRIFQAPTGRFRPAPGGVSIGHKDITAGTLGCLVKKDGEIYILSNNHVLANANAANLGDPILQPGTYDGGKYPDDHIADLVDFVPVNIMGVPSDCNIAGNIVNLLNYVAKLLGSDTRLQAIKAQAQDNLVDAAIARPLKPELVSSEVLKIGIIQGSTRGELGMAIKKSGRTTEFTTGEIQQVDVTVNVQYGEGRVARFTDQLMAGPMSKPGDSGSAVLDQQNQLVGLLFAGGDDSTIINRIENVFSALGVSV